MKRIAATLLCLALAVWTAGACADSWNGTVTALETVQVTSPADGTLESFSLETGAAAAEGDAAGSVRMDKTFAPFDGTVAAMHAEDGEEINGTVLEISPTSLYTLTCTVQDTAQTPENALIHIGETLYVRCTADGSHRATAVVTKISGAEFTAEATGGELYVGETVYLYRDAEYTAALRVGKGTVTSHDPLTVSAKGVIRNLRVQAGDRVERGQWLFSVSSAEENEITIPASGIVTEVKASAGSSVTGEQVLAEIAVSCAIRMTVSADDAGLFTAGQEMAYIRGDDPHEELRPCRVSKVLMNSDDASAEIELIPEDESLLPVGMTILVTEPQE
ncbi:MAG: hypothetical protein K6E17_06420 [Clostridiales bacterium]|nr:hypothetical protein [Clostridiales bacterium]